MALFDNAVLSTENNEENGVNVDEQIIEGNEAYGEALELAAETRLDAEDMMSAERAVVAMEHKLSNEEHLIANPEKITAELVTVANESYLIVASMLGAEAHQVEGVLSSESIESSPISAFQVSHEGAKDFLKKLYESIKLLFKKIANAIKKVVVKLVVAMNGVEKAAKKLQDSLKKAEATPKESKLPESEGKRWSKYFTAVCTMGGVTKVVDEKVALAQMNFYTGLVPNIISRLAELVTDAGYKLNKEDDNVLKTMKAELLKLKSSEPAEYKKLSTMVGDDEVMFPVNANNDILKGLLVTFEEDGDDVKVSFKSGSKKLDGDVDNDVASLTKEQLNKVIAPLLTMAKGLKKFSDSRIKEIDAMYKVLDKNAENKTDGAVSKFILKQKASFGTNIRALVAGVYLDSVLAYSSATKKILAYAKDNAKLLRNNEL